MLAVEAGAILWAPEMHAVSQEELDVPRVQCFK